MVATVQAERIKVANKAAAAKINAVVKEEKAVVKTNKYNAEQITNIVCAILAADKTKLLDIPSAVNKARQVADAING